MSNFSDPLSFAWLPCGDENIASVRLRCLSIHNALKRRGYDSTVGKCSNANVLIIQKILNDKAIAAARQFKYCHRGLVVFDIDDFFESNEFIRRLRKMICLSDLVTTATPEQSQYLARNICGRDETVIAKSFVLRNPFDYNVGTPIKRVHEAADPLRIVWFGYSENIPYELLRIVSSWADIKLTVITDKIEEVRLQLPAGCDLIEWNYNEFTAMMNSQDVALLSHHGTDIVNAKSANKMVTSIMCGVPVIASRTPDYNRVAQLLGSSNLVFDYPTEVRGLIDSLKNPEYRNMYLQRAQSAVLELFTPEKTCDNFLENINKVVQQQRQLNIAQLWMKSIMQILKSYF